MSVSIRWLARLALAASAFAGAPALAAPPCLSGGHLALPGPGNPPVALYFYVPGGAELQNPTALTLDLHFYAEVPQDSRLLAKGKGAQVISERSYDVKLRSDGTVQIDLYLVGPVGNFDWLSLRTTSSIALDTWHRLTATFDSAAGEARLHLDGAVEAVATTDQIGFSLKGQLVRQSPHPLTIGGDPELPQATLHGGIDELRIWTRALSPAEILATATMPLDDLDGLAASFHFDGMSWDLTGGHVVYTFELIKGAGLCASYGHFGTAVAGAGGAPTLSLDAPPVLGTTTALRLGNPTGAPAPAVLVVGPMPLLHPTTPLLVYAVNMAVIGMGPNGATIPFLVPDSHGVVFVQTFVPDPTAPQQVASSRGLYMYMGD